MAFIEEIEVEDLGPDGADETALAEQKPEPTKAKPKKADKPKKTDKPKRDGVPLTEDLIRRKAEHNEGMLSTLEEIALHQLDIDKIEVLNSCRHLQIVYLQNNLISKIEGLNRLKKLDYLNLALNNITRIENLEGCESLRKLDLTVNFIDLDELHTVGKLKNNTALRELYLTGNPCTQHWESGYRDYVIGTLPQLASLDGKEVSKSERIRALQRLHALEAELRPLAALASERREEQRARRAERQRERAEAGSDAEDDEGRDEWCPEVRVEDARELRETKEAQEAAQRESRRQDAQLWGGQAPERERRLLKEDGTPNQMNTAKWPFSIEEDDLNVVVDVALPRFLDSASVDAKVEPTYVRVQAKKHTLQLVLPKEVVADASTAQRSSTTGHLVLTCPKLAPVVVSRAPRKSGAKPKPEALTGAGGAPPLCAPGERLKGAVDVRSIVPTAPGAKPKPKAEEEALGPDFDDEGDVPPLL